MYRVSGGRGRRVRRVTGATGRLKRQIGFSTRKYTKVNTRVRAPKPELKRFYFATGAATVTIAGPTVTTSESIFALVQLGTLNTQRIGNQVTVKRVKFIFNIIPRYDSPMSYAQTGGRSPIITILIGINKNPRNYATKDYIFGATYGVTKSLYLNPATVGEVTYPYLNNTAFQDIIILKKKVIYPRYRMNGVFLAPANTYSFSFMEKSFTVDMKFPKGIVVDYGGNTGTQTDMTHNALWICAYCSTYNDGINPDVSLSHTGMINYTDV